MRTGSFRSSCLSILVLGMSMVTPLGGPTIAAEPEFTKLRLQRGVFDPLTGSSELAPHLRLTSEPRSGYFVIQFQDSIDAELLDQVRRAGAEPIQFVPDRAYIVRVSTGKAQALRDLPQVRWLGPLQPGWKLSPELGTRELRRRSRQTDPRLTATIDLFPGEALASTKRRLENLTIEVLQSREAGNNLRLRVHATRRQLESAASIQAIAWIEEAGEVQMRNDTTHWVIQSNVFDFRPIWDHGLHGEDEIIGHIDGPIDMESCYFRDEADNTPGPNHRKVVAYRSSVGMAFIDTHGTHTAGTAAGDQTPINGSDSNNGNAWAARISHAIVNDIEGFGGTASNLYEYLAAAHDDGARVHTNSWGDDGTTSYTTWSHDIDKFSSDFEESLVIFAATNQGTLRTPENAKNVLAVGATMNGNESDFFCSGGTGPTNDGRRKPEIFAPGCGILSASANSECGIRSSSGTSMAAPAVAAAAVLTRQYFREGWYPSGTQRLEDSRTPTGALLKATLLNATIDISTIAGYPSQREGWGSLLLDDALYFDGDRRKLAVLADIRNATGLGTGGVDLFPVLVEDAEEPLRITLVFTEPPGTLFANSATINNLDLEVVSPSGLLYLGNVIVNGDSQTGGTADPINNVEMAIVANPEIGEWTIRVVGSSVNQRSQGYALVATGQVSALSSGSLRYAGHRIADGGEPLDTRYGNGDGIVDPGETITLPLTLFNLRDLAVTNVSARVGTSRADLARITLDHQSYVDLTAMATAESDAPHYIFTVPPDAECGALIPFEIDAVHADGATHSTFTLGIGNSESGGSSTDTPVSMPPFAGPPSLSTIEINGAVIIGDLQVEVQITHQDVSHMVIELISPTGTTVRLHDLSVTGSPNIDTIFDSEREPDGPGNMDSFNGESAQGVWTLSVLDQVIGGFPAVPGGTIEHWSLSIESDGSAACTPLDCTGDPVPDAVSPTMVVDRTNLDLTLTWPQVVGATSYRVWTSPTADFTTERLIGSSSATTLTLIEAISEPGNWYYRVRAVNSCNWEGP